MDYTGERAIPWDPRCARLMLYHVPRYAWALRWCVGKRVVDLGCGSGYGTMMLSWVAAHVTGVDCAYETLDYAQRHWLGATNLIYRQLDVEVDDLPDADVYVAFELLEHLDEPQALLDTLDGLVLWSVPHLDASRYHRHVYTVETAMRDLGGKLWYQLRNGQIVPGEQATEHPHNILGIRLCA